MQNIYIMEIECIKSVHRIKIKFLVTISLKSRIQVVKKKNCLKTTRLSSKDKFKASYNILKSKKKNLSTFHVAFVYYLDNDSTDMKQYNLPKLSHHLHTSLSKTKLTKIFLYKHNYLVGKHFLVIIANNLTKF